MNADGGRFVPMNRLDTPPTLQPVSGNVNRVQALKVSAYTNTAGNLTR